MFKSLRWRLQVWHALVLLIVLTSFGAIVYDLQWKTRLQQIDAELNRTAGIVMRTRLGTRPGGRNRRNRDDAVPAGDAAPNADQVASTSEPPRNEVEADKPPGPVEPSRERSSREPAESEQPRHNDEESPFYSIIWNDGEIVDKSDSAPEIAYPGLQPEPGGARRRIFRERRGEHVYRELVQSRMNDRGSVRNLVVGQSLDKELSEHHQRGLLLIATGFVILAAGTLGGGWLSVRAIQPINAMTSAAESISVQNLSQRINVNETDSELGNLANVLNKTFDRLQSAFERQRQFTADASHELRTPLSVIATHTELALSRPRSSEDYRAALETCRRASARMRTLIDALLTLARFDSGVSALKQEPVDLEPLIQDCVELVRQLATDRGIQIECQAAAYLVKGDGDRLSQVVINLLTNAIRYNVDSGRVIVSTRSEGGNAVISVVDYGIGIAADQLPRIFDRFYQVDKARSRSDGSYGLGLSICKTIVEAHAGSIKVASQLGVGTTIEVYLPLVHSPVASEISVLNEEHVLSVVPGA